MTAQGGTALQPAVAVTPTSSTVAVVGTTSPPPVVAVGVDWSVIIPVIVTGLSLLLGQVLNYFKSRDNGKKSDAIHVLVNSGMTKALADNASQAEEIRTLRTLVQALNERIAALPPGQLQIAPQDPPSRGDVARAQATLDAGRLPSAEVMAAQQATPKAKD